MKLKFLGTGAATACPLPFCNCQICKDARKFGGKDFRKRSSILINDDLIIDMGPDFMAASFAHEVDTTKICYWLQTHSHSDHFDASHLITRIAEYAAENVKPLSLFASSQCIQHMSEQLSREEMGANLVEVEWLRRLNLNVYNVNHGEEFICGSYSITALNSGHDVNDGSYFYLVNNGSHRLFYGLDADEVTLKEETMDYFSNHNIRLDIIVLDHTYGNNINASDHLNTNKVISIINEMRNRGIINQDTKIFASHISHEGNLLHDEFALFSNKNGYDVAFDGLVVDKAVVM